MRLDKIAIVGSGAIGLYYGTQLALSGADVRFLLRSDFEAVRARGITVRVGDRVQSIPAERVGAYASTADIGPVDLVIVTLKTTANAQLASLIPPLLGPETAVLTLQNGLGSDELLARICGAERVFSGLSFIASNRVGPGEVACFYPGTITLGEFGRTASDRARELGALWTRAGVKCHVADNVAEARWRKLIWNVPFNGLSIATGGLTTDRILADAGLAAEVRALMDEVATAAHALGLEIPESFIRSQLDVTPSLGAYKPSSLLDWQAGREVEVEAIWGEPLRRAQAAGAATPRLALLYSLLSQLTSRGDMRAPISCSPYSKNGGSVYLEPMEMDLIEREITDMPPLTKAEASLLDMHSLLNALNVLHGELALIGLTVVQDSDALRGALGVCHQWLADLRDPERVRRAADQFPALRSRVMSDVAGLVAQHPGKETDPELIESQANLDSVFLVLDLHMRELFARWHAPDVWVPMSLAQLRLSLLRVFAAIGKNSKGRYRIIYNLAMQAPSDYYVKLDFDSAEGDTATMPPVLHDVIRDLLANARKYTKPGGTLAAGFYATPEELKLVVQDTGRGIPENELTEVVRFGRRGSNVGDVRTMGAGFGLTKAYYVTKQFGGRMWIASRLGVGTRISIVIPRPALAA